MKFIKILTLSLTLMAGGFSASAANLTPILLNNGEGKITCDGVMRFMNTAPLTNKQVVASYLFGNLITASGSGADIILWSPSYGADYPPPYTDGPSSQWGPIGDLHIFSQPAGHTGGRQGESYRSFQPDGILINDYVQLAVVCWGGGTLELYAVIYVRDATP